MEAKKVLLYFTQIVHLIIDFFCMFYVFLFSAMYDIYFCGFILLQTLHWIALRNECIVSYIEKKLIDPGYVLGSKPRWLPHYNTFYNKYTKMIKAILIIGGLLFVVFRTDKNYIKAICLAAILLWVYLTYFHIQPHTNK